MPLFSRSLTLSPRQIGEETQVVDQTILLVVAPSRPLTVTCFCSGTPSFSSGFSIRCTHSNHGASTRLAPSGLHVRSVGVTARRACSPLFWNLNAANLSTSWLARFSVTMVVLGILLRLRRLDSSAASVTSQ